MLGGIESSKNIQERIGVSTTAVLAVGRRRCSPVLAAVAAVGCSYKAEASSRRRAAGAPAAAAIGTGCAGGAEDGSATVEGAAVAGFAGGAAATAVASVGGGTGVAAGAAGAGVAADDTGAATTTAADGGGIAGGGAGDGAGEAALAAGGAGTISAIAAEPRGVTDFGGAAEGGGGNNAVDVALGKTTGPAAAAGAAMSAAGAVAAGPAAATTTAAHGGGTSGGGAYPPLWWFKPRRRRGAAPAVWRPPRFAWMLRKVTGRGLADYQGATHWRSVVPKREPAEPADDLTVWLRGLRWVEAAWMQASRLTDVAEHWFGAVADARLRASLNEDTDNAREWRDGYETNPNQEFDPRSGTFRPAPLPVRVPTFALHTQVSAEFEFFVIAVRNVMRAQDRLPEDKRPKMTDQRLFHLTRNVTEHFDNVGGWSEVAFANEYPDRGLGQIGVTSKELYVSDVPISRVIAWLERVKQALTQAIKDTDPDALPPSDDASVVEGDDDLAWPAERRRERLWQVPQLDMADWPTEEMPPEVEEILQQKFRLRRLRDGVE